MAMMCGSMAMKTCVLSSSDLRTAASPFKHVTRTKSVLGVKSRQNSLQCRAFFNVENDPIVKEALKEPIAFLGGVFAGLLRLDINEEPLREWVAKTAEAAGIETEEPESTPSDSPNEIQIE